jgi:hypothetical protein
MAALSTAERAHVMALYMEEASRDRLSLPLTKPQFAAAIAAIDDWVESNAAAFNSAIPQPARSTLTAQQKAALLAYVVRRRYEVS